MSPHRRLDAVVFDVGGTLLPKQWPLPDDVRDRRVRRLVAAVGIDPERAGCVVDAVLADRPRQAADHRWEPDVHIAGVLRRIAIDVDPVLVRRAICEPAASSVSPFVGAQVAVAAAHVAARVVVLDNTTFRDGATMRADLTDAGFGGLVDDVVTAVDVGYGKPHPAMFEAALLAADVEPAHAVMIGDSEPTDLAPARRLGMRTILVAIEDPPPATSAADAIVTSLLDIPTLLAV